MIYFIRAALSRRIKIGWSQDTAEVGKRFDYLRRDNADDLSLIGWIEGDIAAERALHREVSFARAHNEWFEAWPEVEDLVARELGQEGTLPVVVSVCTEFGDSEDPAPGSGPEANTDFPALEKSA